MCEKNTKILNTSSPLNVTPLLVRVDKFRLTRYCVQAICVEFNLYNLKINYYIK